MKKFEFYDIMFPNQEQASTYYQGNRDEINKKIYDMACKYSTNEELDITSLEFPKDFPAQQYMGASPIVQSFQHFLLSLIHAKRVLEIGTFVGCSTIRMAKTIAKWGGKIHTIEKYNVFAEIAKRNFEKMKCDNVKIFCGDAFEIMGGGELEDEYDFIFIDGNKENYKYYLEKCWPKLRSGGIVMFDDAFLLGDTLNSSPTTKKGIGVSEVLDYIHKEGNICCLIPSFSGICIVQKRGVENE